MHTALHAFLYKMHVRFLDPLQLSESQILIA